MKKQLTILFTAALLRTCGQAGATKVSYTFDETGFVNTAGTTENFSGVFTGSTDANGDVTLSTLAFFSATLTETNSQNETKTIATFAFTTGTSDLTDFLYDPIDGNLTLSAAAPGATICLGGTIAQGDCGPVGPRPVSMTGVRPPPLQGLFISTINSSLSADSTSLPSVTLEQPVTIPPGRVPTPANTPEPGSFILCGTALMLISLILRRSLERGTTL